MFTNLKNYEFQDNTMNIEKVILGVNRIENHCS